MWRGLKEERCCGWLREQRRCLYRRRLTDSIATIVPALDPPSRAHCTLLARSLSHALPTSLASSCIVLATPCPDVPDCSRDKTPTPDWSKISKYSPDASTLTLVHWRISYGASMPVRRSGLDPAARHIPSYATPPGLARWQPSLLYPTVTPHTPRILMHLSSTATCTHGHRRRSAR